MGYSLKEAGRSLGIVVMFGDGSRVNWIMKETVDELRADWEQQIGEVIRKRISEKGERDAE
jgi:hypothetical protein